MPPQLAWTDPADEILIRLRAEGATWAEIASAFGIHSSTAMGRGRRLAAIRPSRRPRRAIPATRARFPDPARPPLPAGHEVSWGALTDATLLAGAAYHLPAPALRVLGARHPLDQDLDFGIGPVPGGDAGASPAAGATRCGGVRR